ncbi:prenyltransferase/squalene oxidase repeat-containing protein [Actinokineospora bangkokensis]|uniref:Geranylgeranyl transferase type II subunit beta n=1 Tax=Actinokineospora bangkokensis TaxID=1193682 RepID=A0A1Q9LKX3_9PSEU|nr:prenyltransferase/squalene oxidase repeat-containing protein [Actinokineospora bangkokensis]OLR92678.1 hypothetical protein BJP25_21880 [Actinokineospora bangkokensis]
MTSDALLDPVPVVSGESDLWCTYAAVRTLRWLDRTADLPDPGAVAGFLASRRNADGGYAWSAGMNSDAWATYYCTQAVRDLGGSVPSEATHPSSGWVLGTHNPDGGFAMTPGQASDVWATYYAVRTLVEVHGETPPESVLGWLGGLQAADGGLTWSPAHAVGGTSDVRACYYAITAWSTMTGGTGPLPWDRERLLGWLRGKQGASGGFTFQDGDGTDCLWATFRATSALRRLGADPRDRDGCVAWIRGRLAADGSFTRWPGYPVQDVWAAFCGVGSLRELGDDTRDLADRVVRAVLSFRVGSGGFTYRDPRRAADVLTTSAHLLSGRLGEADRHRALRWMGSCVLPNEDGVMYMPGRGSEVRCTLWALSAGALAEDGAALARVGDWLVTSIQNPDGGFGYWEGRASDVVSTCAAAEVLHLVGEEPGTPVMKALAGFAASCEVAPGEFANVPGGSPALRPTLQALRALRRAGAADAGAAAAALERHRVRGGGFANEGRRLPDLLSTYEAVLTADAFGLEVDLDHLRRFVDRVRVGAGSAWTPLVRVSGGPLADCLGARLDLRLAGEPLPALTIS